MIEKIVLDYLNEHASVKAYMERPENKPVSFILIEKTGSRRANVIEQSTIAVQSYAPSLYEAAQLNEEIKSLMYSMTDLDEISGVHLNSDYNFTNTADKQYRYQAVFVVTHF